MTLFNKTFLTGQGFVTIQKIQDAEDLNGALLYLLSDTNQYMTGQNLIVDDGFGL